MKRWSVLVTAVLSFSILAGCAGGGEGTYLFDRLAPASGGTPGEPEPRSLILTHSSPAGSFRLANKEYQMMELLLRNPRQLIPTERFLERIWGYDSEVEVSVVWVYISYLRKKLAALQADVEIRASRNLGYALEVRA